MGAARESTSKGARSVTAVTVAGQESVIQKNLQAAKGGTQGGQASQTVRHRGGQGSVMQKDLQAADRQACDE